LIHINQANLLSEGKDLLERFIMIIQTYKSSGNISLAQKFYDQYSTVSAEYLSYRAIIMAKQEPRALFLQHNLFRYTENQIDIQSYPRNFEGLIHSWADRYEYSEKLRNQIMNEVNKRKDDLRI